MVDTDEENSIQEDQQNCIEEDGPDGPIAKHLVTNSDREDPGEYYNYNRSSNVSSVSYQKQDLVEFPSIKY